MIKGAPIIEKRRLANIVIPLIDPEIMFLGPTRDDAVAAELVPDDNLESAAICHCIIHLYRAAASIIHQIRICALEAIPVIVGTHIQLRTGREVSAVTSIEVTDGVNRPVSRVRKDGLVGSVGDNLVARAEE